MGDVDGGDVVRLVEPGQFGAHLYAQLGVEVQGGFLVLAVGLLVGLAGVMGASSLLLAFHLIATAGAVFYSQSAYTMTIAGVLWGMLLLNEELSVLAWIAFAVIAVGMYLVEPKSSNEKLVIRRAFNNGGGTDGGSGSVVRSGSGGGPANRPANVPAQSGEAKDVV